MVRQSRGLRELWSYLIFFILFLLFLVPTQAQRTGYSTEEFIRRRQALMEKAGGGIIILFGEVTDQPAAHFRQDNDFFYFTGVEDKNAVLVLIPKSKEAVLFLPRQTQREEIMEGPNWLKDQKSATKLGLTRVQELSEFEEFLARSLNRAEPKFYLRLSPRDQVDMSRGETRIFVARKNRLHYNDILTLDEHRTNKLRARFPAVEFCDLTPYIDELRLIKTEEEIAILRRNGRLSAEAIRQAMLASRPGVYEYEVEAAAVYHILKAGARGPAYAPIVGSGPNTCIQHYNKNSRRIEEGDLILMDFGADLDQLCIDITRTWPASGKFTPEQREVYEIVLAVEKACLEAYRPGITAEDVRRHVAEVLKRKKIDGRGLTGGIGHYVGLSTHDVGPAGVPLRPGMVFAIEPALYYPEKNIGIRIEDTVLITKEGCEVLTREVPKEVNEIEELLRQRVSVKAR
ncbi:MAG: aminopeptidase P N-terminal domain-containing protein [Candidatus Aminicenantales bacterium]